MEVHEIKPQKNAVVVQLLDMGAGELKRIIHIECLDKDMLPKLKELAKEIMREVSNG